MRSVFSAMLLLAGCSTSDTATTEPCFDLDAFDAAAIDERLWGIYEEPPATIDAIDGTLEVSIVPLDPAYASVYSQRIGFRDATAAVEVVAVPTEDGAEALLQWVVNDRFRHFIAIEAGRLYLGTELDGEYSSREIVYDATEHRFWRLRELNERVLYETSRDGTAWVPEYDEPLAIPIDEAYVELAAGSYVPVASPSVARFDNFSLAAECVQ